MSPEIGTFAKVWSFIKNASESLGILGIQISVVFVIAENLSLSSIRIGEARGAIIVVVSIFADTTIRSTVGPRAAFNYLVASASIGVACVPTYI